MNFQALVRDCVVIGVFVKKNAKVIMEGKRDVIYYNERLRAKNTALRF